MSTWSPQNSLITNLGNSLLASAGLGLGTIRVTRVLSRETFESTVSDVRGYTLADVTSDFKQEGHIIDIRLTDYPDPEEEIETSLLTVRFSNEDLEDEDETYNLRQLVILASLVDAETQVAGEEVPYMVCQCDSSSDCDVMPARSVNPTSFDYNIYVIHSGVDEITINIRTSGYVWQEDFDSYKIEVNAKFDDMEDSFDEKLVGVKNEGKTFTSWSPVYDETHTSWSKTTEDEVTALEGAESFSQTDSDNNFATGSRSTSFGKDNEVLSENSFVTGLSNYINSPHSFVAGSYNSVRLGGATHYANTVFGAYNEIKGSSCNTVLGNANEVKETAENSLTSGTHLINSTVSSTVLGKYNVEDIDSSYALIVGGGNSNKRSNIFTLDWSGNIEANSTKTNSVYVDKIYNLDGTEKDFGGGIPEDFIKRGTAVSTFITNDTLNNKASSPYATAFGKNTVASGRGSTTFGENTKANGANSIASGSNTYANGSNSFVSGEWCGTESRNSAVIASDESTGLDAKSAMSAILASSFVNVDNSGNSDDVGYNFIAATSGFDVKNSIGNVILGCNGISELENGGFNIVAGGITSILTIKNTGNSKLFANGKCNFTENSNLIACGEEITAHYTDNCNIFGSNLSVVGASDSRIQNQTVIGKYNKNDSDKLFIIGCGTSESDRFNVFTVDVEGNIYIKENQKSLNAFVAGAVQFEDVGVPNGVAGLDNTGRVPVSQIPGGISSMIEGYLYEGEFYEESTHETIIPHQENAIYVDIPSNKTYRWSGSAYTEISESLALGETSSTAYRGDRGKIAYDHATDSNKVSASSSSGLYKIGVTSEGHIASVTEVQKSDITALGIPAQDTTYESKAEASSGTDVSLCTTGEKYNWNRPQNSLLTGYEKSSTSGQAVAATDTISQGLGKIEKRVEDNETNISKDEAALVELVDGGAKNILQIGTAVTVEKNGVTAVSNTDGSVTISGVSTSGSQFLIINDLYSGSTTSTYSSQIPIKAGNYVVKATGTRDVLIQAINYNSSTDAEVIDSSNDDVKFTATKSYIAFRLVIGGNTDFTTPVTIYPMCCDSALYAISPEVVPYRPSYQELYERVVALEQANQ